MDKLEHYLDQVCRRIGGTRALRQHIRQELEEHLKDAVAGHRAAGIGEEEALARALADFGGPDEVRSELELTHGHRLLAVAIDKALEWKERIMKAKWLWLSGAHLALMGVIALGLLGITFAQVFLVPKFFKLSMDGYFDPGLSHSDVSWLYSVFDIVRWLSKNLVWLVLLSALVWGLFEWRVHSENKTFMRLAALGTIALALLILCVFTLGSMLVLMFMGLPGSGMQATRATAGIEVAIYDIERGLAKKDWRSVEDSAKKAGDAMEFVTVMQKRLPASADARPEELAAKMKIAREALGDVAEAGAAMDTARAEAALRTFRDAYDPVRRWAARLGQ